MFDLRSQLQRTPAERKAYIAALSRVEASEEHRDLFEHLYACLSILDAKSQSLLGFNSIILAVFAVFLTQALPAWPARAAYAGMAVILCSSFLLLSVVWVRWSTAEDLADADQHALRLLAVRNRRTVRYRLAWALSVVSLLALGSLLVLSWV